MSMVILKSGTVVCYSCYNDGAGELDSWVPDDPENYPCGCELCDYVATGPDAGYNRYERKAQPVLRVDQRFNGVLVKPRYFYSLGEAQAYCEQQQANGWKLKITDVTPQGV